MKARIGPQAKLYFFTQKKFDVFTFNPAHTSLMGISSPVRLPSPQRNELLLLISTTALLVESCDALASHKNIFSPFKRPR